MSPAGEPHEALLLPLTEAQRGVWFAAQLEPRSPAFACAEYVELHGALDHRALREAADRALAEADGLSAWFVEQDGEPFQAVPAHPRITPTSLRDLRDALRPEEEFRHAIAEDVGTPRDLTGGAPDDPAGTPRGLTAGMPSARTDLVHSVLFALPGERWRWYLRVHHLLTDAYAFALLERRAAELYGALTDADGDRRPPVDTPFATTAETVAHDAAYAGSPQEESDREHWAAWEALDVEVPSLATTSVDGGSAPRPAAAAAGDPVAPGATIRDGRPATDGTAADGPDPDVVPVAGRLRVTGTLDPALTARLREAVTGMPWTHAVAVTVADYLAAMTGSREAVLGIPLMNRAGRTALRSVSTQVNVLPLRLPVEPGRDVAELARDLDERLGAVRRHQRWRAERLGRGAGARPGGPTTAVQLNLKPFDTELRFGGLTGRVRYVAAGPVHDLEVTAYLDQGSGTLHLDLDAASALHDLASARAHHARLLARLADLAGRPDPAATPLGGLPVATRGELAELAAWNATARDLPETTLTGLLAAQAARTPHAPALRADGLTLTYAELAGRAAAVGDGLTAAGIGPGDTVAVLAPRGAELVIALLGTLAAGAAYLPLDPEHPDARLTGLLADSGARALLTVAAERTRADAVTAAGGPPVTEVGPGAPVAAAACASRGDAGASGEDADASPQPAPAGARGMRPGDRGRPPRPDDPAYVIYTSGSTGTPKGVVVPHRGIVNRLLWMQHAYGLTPADRVLQKTPATFDVSVWEFFWPLITGAVLVVARPGGHRDPEYLADLIRREGVTTAHFVPSMLGVFLAEDATRATAGTLRRVLCSGEALPADAVEAFARHLPGVELHNLYGPTEASVDVTWWDCLGPSRLGMVPIGRPIWNTRVAVLDAAGRELPPGGLGELHLGGVQLATGYLGRPELTAERFPVLPAAIAGAPPGSRWYRTGDLARWRRLGADDAVLEYCGRTDHQVKIRGQRIELGEVEAALAGLPGVAAATVLALPDAAGDLRLVGYAVLAEDAVLTERATAGSQEPAALRARLAAILPPAMVPAQVVILDRMPVGAHGKLDRSALPAPSVPEGTREAVLAADPVTELALSVAAEVLGLPSVDPDQGFFDLGGDSLKAARLVSRLRAACDAELTLASVFAAPDLGSLLAPRGRDGDALGVRLRLRDRGEPGVVVCLHPAGGLSWCYAGLLPHLRDTAVYGLQSPVFTEGGRGSPGDPVAPDDLASLARRYAAEVADLAQGRPVRLVGWSVGGVLAHAVAAELQTTAPGQVTRVLLLDAYPASVWHGRPEPHDHEAWAALLTMGGLDGDALVSEAAASGVVLDESWVAERLRGAHRAMATLPAEVLSAVPGLVRRHAAGMRRHRPPLLDADVIVVEAAAERRDARFDPQAWGPHVGGRVEVVRLDLRHPELVSAEALRMAAELLDR